MDRTYTSFELYNYYKKWLNDSIKAYRDTACTAKRDQWLKLSYRAACLTDLHLRLCKEYQERF